ncbi:MAG: hypothetical protein RI516_05370 [Spiribacter sp.]|nr:hypothetical protein [Spiribacter sp.]
MDSVQEMHWQGKGTAMDGQRSGDAAFTQELRNALEPVLPYGPSLIPLDILATVALAHEHGNALTMKQLLAGLPYSATGIRYNLAQLLADGWLVKSAHGDDRRLVCLLPSAKMAEAFASVRLQALSLLEQSPH